MAHFAEIKDGKVLRVIVVANKDILDSDGKESEVIGQVFCNKLLGGEWVQTSYNGTIRKNYAGIGFTYDKERDAFIPPKPYKSWVLDEEKCSWKAPKERPSDMATWNEEKGDWDEQSLAQDERLGDDEETA